jgi:hypothetical protein
VTDLIDLARLREFGPAIVTRRSVFASFGNPAFPPLANNFNGPSTIIKLPEGRVILLKNVSFLCETLLAGTTSFSSARILLGDPSGGGAARVNQLAVSQPTPGGANTPTSMAVSWSGELLLGTIRGDSIAGIFSNFGLALDTVVTNIGAVWYDLGQFSQSSLVEA